MEIKQDLRIQAKSDSCIVSTSKTGKLTIGSITIDPDEVEDFISTLTVALKTLNEAKKP